MITAIDRPESSDFGERSAQEARILLEIAQAAGSTLDLGEVLSRVVERTASLTGADRCSIWLLDRTHEWLLPAALYGMDPGFTAQWKRSVLNVREERLSEEVIATGRPVVVLDAGSDPRTDKNAVAMFSDKSILIVPLMTKGRVIGTLFTNHVEQRYAFSDQDVAVTVAIASQAAVAIENAQLYEESRHRSEELFDSFRRIGDALTAGLDLCETLQIIVNLATDMVYASVGCLELLGPDGCLLVEATRGIALAECQARVAERGDSLGQEVVETRRPLNVSDLQLLAKRYPHNPFGDVSGSYLGLPLRRRGELLGVLAVYDRHAGRFSNSEIDLLHSFANQAAVAIDNAQLFAATQQQVADLKVANGRNATLIDSLEAERNRLNAIIQNSSDAIYIVDSNLRIIAFNPAAERLTGWTESEAVGAECSEILGCNHSLEAAEGADQPAICHMLRVFQTREPIPYVELITSTREGQRRDLAASYSYVPATENSGPVGVAIARDISQIKEVERLKSEFISMVSHDLRTPLAVIKGYAATLLNPNLKLDEDRKRRFTVGINDASDKLTRIIDNLLSVSRLESGRFRLTPQQFDLCELITKAAGLYQAGATRHRFVAETPLEPLWVVADRDLIEQVITNLIGNAVKYSSEAGDIRIRGRVVEGGTEVTVHDRGMGIPPGQQHRVFEKYYRGDTAVARRISGTGLGLYICKSIVEAHGGRIWVESAPGEGSTFAFVLPTGESSLPSAGDLDQEHPVLGKA
jgi:PAS domain S-box-containing protein